jgi:hypothetical protein
MEYVLDTVFVLYYIYPIFVYDLILMCFNRPRNGVMVSFSTLYGALLIYVERNESFRYVYT